TAAGTASVCFAAPAASVKVNEVRRTSPPNVSSILVGAGTETSAAGTDDFNGVCACAATASAKPRANATKRFMRRLLGGAILPRANGPASQAFPANRPVRQLLLRCSTAGIPARVVGTPQNRWYGGAEACGGPQCRKTFAPNRAANSCVSSPRAHC